MWNPFKKKDKARFHFDFDTFNNLFDYLYNENSRVSVVVEGLKEEAEVLWYEFPSSYQDKENQSFVKKRGFKNFYELINTVYRRAELTEVDVELSVANDYQYDLMPFTFYMPPLPDKKDFLRYTKHSFYVFLVNENNSEQLNAFRVMYSSGLHYGINDLYGADFLPDINNPSLEEEPIVAAFEKVVAALALETHVKINPHILAKHAAVHISKEVSLQDFRDLLNGINYWKHEDMEEKAKDLFRQYIKPKDEQVKELELIRQAEDGDYEYDDGFFTLRFELFYEENFWHSDWKFDPEDMEYFISSLLKEDWTFDYPEETYSHDLFPYIQSRLAERGLALMNMDTLGDDYIFFLAKKQNVGLLLRLSQKMRLGIEQL